MRKHYLVLLLFVIAGLFTSAQINNNDFNVSNTSNNLGTCGNNSTSSVAILAKAPGGFSNFFITFDLPAGVDYVVGTAVSTGGSAPVVLTEFDVTNLSQPVFEIAGTWGLGQTFNFDYERTAGCASVEQALAGGLFKDKYSITYSGGVAASGADNDTTTQTYELEYASLSIQNITTANTNVGEQVLDRPVVLVQGGNGYTESLTYYVVVDTFTAGSYVLGYNGTPLVPTISNDTFFYDIDFSVAPWLTDFGSTFDNGETITFEETFTVKLCNPTPVRHSAFYGCSPGEKCQEASSQTGSILLGSELPNITITGVGNSSTFILCDTNFITYTITNTNTNSGAAALDILINVGAGTNNVNASTYENSTLYLHSNRKPATNFQINGDSTPVATWSSLLPTVGSQYTTSQVAVYNQITVDPDGPGVGLEDLDGDGFYDDLPPGESFTFSYNVLLNPDFSSACGIAPRSFISYEHMYTQVVHKNQCGLPRPGSTTDLNYSTFSKNYAGVPSTLEAPTDLDPQPNPLIGLDTFQVMVRTQFNRTSFACGGGATEKYQVRIPLPPGVGLDASATPNMAAGLNPVFFFEGDTLVYEISGDGSANYNREFEFPLTFDCGTWTGGVFLSLEYITRFKCDPTCLSEDIECHVLPQIAVHCGSGCPGIVTKGLDNNRLNGGWTDNTRTSRVVLDPNIHNTKYYLTTDTMEVTSFAYINDTTLDNAHFRLSFSSLADLEFIDGEIMINDISSGTYTGPLTVAPVTVSSGTNQTTTFDLSSYRSLVSPTYEYGEGIEADTVWLTMRYYIPNNFSSQVDQDFTNMQGRFFCISATNVERSCDVYGSSATAHDPFVYETQWLNNTVYNECATATIRHGLYNRGLSFQTMPGEYRPAYNMDSVIFTLPDYLEYIPNTAYFQGGWTEAAGDVATVWDPINRTLIVKPSGNFSEPQYGSSFMHAHIQVDIKCGAPAQLASGGAIPVGIYWDDYAYNPAATVEINTVNNASANIYSFNAPAYTMQSANPIAQGTQPEVEWDIQIDKTSTGNTAFNWFRIEDIPGINITGVYSVVGAVETLLNTTTDGTYTYVEIGALNGASLTDYIIRSTYSVCTDQSFDVNIGWGCNGYPTDYGQVDENLCYTETVTLGLEPKVAQAQIVVSDQPPGAVPMCTSFDVELEVNSAQFADLVDPYITFITPGGPGALTIIGDSVSVEYPANSGDIQNVSVTIVGALVTINLLEHTKIDSIGGIFGTSNDPSADGRLAVIDMSLRTECNFIANSQITYRVYGNSPCGAPATGNGSSSSTGGIEVVGAVRLYDIFSSITGPANGIQGCNAIDTVAFSSVIIAPGLNQTGTEDSAYIYLPQGIDYVPGSFNCTSANCPIEVGADTLFGQNIIKLYYPPGLGNNTTMDYTVALMSNDSVCDDMAEIVLSSFVGYGGVACDTFVCPNVRVETGNTNAVIPVTKPQIVGQVPNSNAKATYVPGTNFYNVLLELYNADALLTMDSGYVFDLYCADSLGNIAGPSLYTDVTSQQIAPMGSIMEEFEFMAGPQCDENYGLVAELVPSATNCQCAAVRFNIPLTLLPPIEAFDDADTTNPGIPVSVNVLANDSNYLSTFDTTSVAEVSAPLNGSTMVNPDGTITYTSDPSFSGLDSFTYAICTQEVAANCDTATVTIYVPNTTDAKDDINATLVDVPVSGNVLTNDNDAQGDMQLVNPTPLSSTTNGSLILNPNGNYTYTPNPGFTGSDVFVYEVCDNGSPVACDTATVYITVIGDPTPGNDPPIAIQDISTTEVNVPVDMNLTSNDSDPDGDMITINTTPVSNPSNGSVVINPDGTATYTPDSGFVGIDTFEYVICDPFGLCDTTEGIVTIIPDVQNEVFANDDAGTGLQDNPITGSMTDNDFDPEGDTYFVNSLTPVTDVTNGSVTLFNDGSYIYTPNPGFTGNDEFTYELCDNGTPQACDIATVYLTVLPGPNTTEASDDINSTPVNIAVNGNVLTNDNDEQGDNQLVNPTVLSGPSNGTVTIAPNGNYIYTPNTDYTGHDEFTYEVCDDGSPVACDTATVYITVIADPVAGNNPPVANMDAGTTEVDTPVDGDLLSNDFEPDGDVITVNTTPVTTPSNGGVVINADGTYTYTPGPGFVGVDTFTYSICDPFGLCDTAIAVITIIEDFGNETFTQDDAGTGIMDNPINGDVTLNDSDPEGDTQGVNTTPLSGPVNGSVVINADGTFTYMPNPGFVGNDQFVYESCDNGSPVACDTATVVLTVIPPYIDPIVAVNDSSMTGYESPVNINVIANDTADAGFDNSSLAEVTPPVNGTIVANTDGTIDYTPNNGFSGIDSFEYVICDVQPTCDTATVYVTVDIAPNTPPNAVDNDTTTLEDTPVVVNPLDNDTDLEGPLDSTTVTIVTPPNNATATVDPVTGEVTITPDPNFVGEIFLQYEVCDTGMPVYCDIAAITVTIIPVADTIPVTVPEDSTINVCTTNSVNFEDPISSISICENPENGVVTPSFIPCLDYTPDPGYIGPDTVCVVTCAGSFCDTTIIVIDVTPVNDPPVAVNDDTITLEDTPVVVDVINNDSDIEGPLDSTSVVVTTPPTNGTATPNGDGTVTYTPDPNFVGVDMFTYAVCDTGMPVLCDTAIVTITITSAPDTIYETVPEDSMVTVCTDGSVNFADPITSVSVCDAPDNGSIVPTFLPCAVYTPTPGYVGPDTMCLVTCAGAFCDTTIVIIDVTPVNDPPVAQDTSVTTVEDQPVTICPTYSDMDGVNEIITAISCGPNVGALANIDLGDSCITYTPTPDFVGVDEICYVVCDSAGLCDTAVITITITSAPDTIYETVPEDSMVTVCTDGSVNFADPITSVTICDAPDNGTIAPTFLPCVDYTPAPGYIGQDTMCVVTCAGSFCDTTIVVITVTPTNDPPVAVNDDTTTLEDTPVVVDVINNDSDIEGPLDSTSVAIVSGPSNGTATPNGDGTVTYTPDPDFVGVDMFTYAVCDTGMPVLCDTAVVTITITSAPDTIYETVPEDSTITVCTDGSVNFADPITSVTICDAPDNGTIAPTFLPCVDYTPAPGYIGPDTMCVVTCAGAFCDTTIVIIDVTPVNDPPVAVNDDTTTLEDTPVVVDVINNDSDIEGPLDSTSVAIVSGPSNGTATPNGDGTVTYTPDPDFVGVDMFTYAVCDTGMPVLCDTAVVTITITSTPDTIYETVPEDSTITVCTDGSTNFAGPIDNIQLCDAPDNGVATPTLLPCVDYTPNPDYNGPDTMCIVSCSNGFCDTTIVIIDVTPVNDPPVAVDDVETTEEDTPVTVDVLNNDSDLEGPLDTTSVVVTTPPTNGTATVNPDGTIDYTPDPDFVGVDVFTYAVCDTGMPVLCDTAVVTITITSAPDTIYETVPEDSTITVCTDGSTNFAAPIDNIQLCDAPDNGVATPTLLPCVDYTPNPDYNGPDTMCIVSCANGFCDTTIVIIDVTPVNDPPVAVDDVETTTEDTPVTVDVLDNDTDLEGPLDTTSVAVTVLPTNGTATVNPDGTIDYTPDPNFCGVDMFSYIVCDTGMPVLCDVAMVTITIECAPDTSYVTLPEDSMGTLCTDSVTNLAAPIDNIYMCEFPDNGSVSTSFIPCVDYIPNPDYYGPDTVCIVTCAAGVCDTTIVIIDVTPIVDVPVLDPIANICESEPIPALTGTSEPGSVIQWIENGVVIGTGSPFVPPAVPGVNCYQAVAFHAGLGLTSPDTAEVCFTIDSLPTNVFAGPDDTICGFQDYPLAATGNGLVTFWTQIVGQTVALDAGNPNAVVALEPNNAPGTDNYYTFVWTNVNGLCRVSDTVTIIVTNPHLTFAGNDTAICLPEAGGSVQLNATLTPSANGWWEYVGNGNITFSDSTDAHAVVDGLVPYVNPTSTYRFIWFEQIADCIASDEVIITVNEAPGLNVPAADTSCLGSDYLLDAGITGFSQASYSWRLDSPTGTILAWDEDVIVNPEVNTTYYVVASVSFGQNFCSTIDSIDIIIDGAPIASDDGCYDVFEDSVLVGNTADWSANDDLSAVFGAVAFEVYSASQLDPASTLVVDNVTDTYVYTPFSNMSGVDTAIIGIYNENCPDLVDTFVVCFNVIPVADDPIVAVIDTVDVIAETTVGIPVLVNDTLNDEAVDTIITILTPPLYGSIDPEVVDGEIVYTSETPYAEVDSFQYLVCQHLVDGEELCDSTWVYVLVDGELYIPEGFTPNGDGINDVFEIPNIELLYPNASLKIFNRWGDEVWNSKGAYRNTWGGLNFNDVQLPDGTYFYIIELNNGSDRSKASFVVIYR